MNVLALALAAVFAWAGVTKLRDRAATAASFDAFGLPVPAALAVVVPVAELALAVLLGLSPVLGAAFALATLAGFTAQLLLARRRGVVAGCGCFGGRRPASPSAELARNALLAAAAAAVLVTA